LFVDKDSPGQIYMDIDIFLGLLELQVSGEIPCPPPEPEDETILI